VSKAINFGDFSLTKQLLYVDIEFRVVSGSVAISVITDGNVVANTSTIGSSSDITGTIGNEDWGDPVWGGTASTTTSAAASSSSSNVPYRLQVNKPTRTVKIKVANANNDETFVLLGFKLYFRPYAQSKFDSAHKLTGGVLTGSSTSITTETGDTIETE
jgi:hypothetical protein